MKAVMISIRPEWCEKIISGKKTVEVRKTRPKIEPPYKCYIYCTDGNTIYQSNADGIIRLYRKKAHKNFQHHSVMNGKVIGEFICDAIIRNCEMSNADIAEQHGCIHREALLYIQISMQLRYILNHHLCPILIYPGLIHLSNMFIQMTQTMRVDGLLKSFIPSYVIVHMQKVALIMGKN